MIIPFPPEPQQQRPDSGGIVNTAHTVNLGGLRRLAHIIAVEFRACFDSIHGQVAQVVYIVELHSNRTTQRIRINAETFAALVTTPGGAA